jgi:phosphoribosylformylglycinamidine (FGAM) synthase-like enzyme
VHEIEEIQLNNQPDIAVWDLERGGNFTTSSLYQRVITEGVQDVRAMECWNAKLPLKVFLWILNKNRIQSTDQLLKKK